MSYEPTKWQTGDIITLNKLNKLEQGVAAMMEEYEPTVWQIGDTVTSTKLNKLEQAVAALSENCGTMLGEMAAVGIMNASESTIYVSTMPYDIMNEETEADIGGSIYNNANVLRTNSTGADVPSGCYVVVQITTSADWTTDSLTVFDANDEQQITDGFECRVFAKGYGDYRYTTAYFTMQIPVNGLSLNFGSGDVG